MYNTVLFDLDGTLINSERGITAGVRYALREFGMEPLPYELQRSFIGPPIRASFIKYCHADAETAEELLRLYRIYYSKTGLHEAEPYAGIEALLSELKNAGKELFVSTAKPTAYSRTILEDWKLDGYFKEIIGAGFDKNFETKDKIIALTKSMASHPEIIMVGDTVYDVLGARANGIDTIGVLYGFGDHDELRASRPLYIAETVEEIGRYI